MSEILELPLGDNEFTTSELLIYINRAYRSKVNQTKFSNVDLVSTWLHLGRIPNAYGGNKLSARKVSGIRIYTVEGLSREDLRYVRDHMENPGPIEVKKVSTPRRTALYYKLANITPPSQVLPDNWRALGIRGNQLTTRKKK